MSFRMPLPSESRLRARLRVPCLDRAKTRRAAFRTAAGPFAAVSAWVPAFVGLGLALLLGGCTPSIGDGCLISTDCSSRGDRVCDTSQPAGYCTVLGCRADSCPDDAACVLFQARVPGCGPDGRELSRVGRSLCVKTCDTNEDCRSGYRCVDPRISPIHGIRLEAVSGGNVCIPQGSLTETPASEPAVCKPAKTSSTSSTP